MEKLQPKLRFPEFKEDWEDRKLEDFCTFFSGGTPTSSNKKYYGGNIPFIKSGEINSEKTEQFLTNDGLINSSAKLIDKGDILYALYGATSGQVSISKISGAINQAILCIRPKNVDNNFLKEILSFRKQNIVDKYIQGGQGNLSGAIVKNLSFNFPTLQEQTKIADFLGAVDKQLDILNQKKEKLNTYKKGVMQQLFAQQLRFKDDNGNDYPDWQEKTLGEVLKYTQPNKFIVKSTDYNNLYNIPVLTAGKSFLLGYTNETDNIYKNIPCIIFDDFTTSSQFVDFEFKIKSSAMKILNTIGNDNIKFLFELINTIHFPTGDEHKRYWISEYSKLKLSIPSIEEQTKIAEFLSAIDKQIEAVENQITKTETYKKGLLQQMFV